MPKRTDIQTILVIGSGPIVIGQACEFDYSGTQAIKALKSHGYRIILINSNPATIMTDPELADATYVEPLTVEMLEKIIAREKPDVLLPTLGGQTALNLATAAAQKGILKKYNVELIGASQQAIQRAEDRRQFRKIMTDIGLDIPRSGYAYDLDQAQTIAGEIGYPLIIRPSFTLGGIGSGTVYTHDEFINAAARGIEASPIGEILIEESIVGWKEFELEVMRDSQDNCVVICSIENVDPMGVHTGDSITVAPIQTLTDREYQRMRDAAFKVIRAIGVETGGSNIQFAVDPQDGRMVVIEMNPRVSRSSALASKATGFPIAKIAALLAVGFRLDEIPNDITKKTPACFEPTIDYVVTKIPRFAFEKFSGSDTTLNTAMKSVGEVMALGRTFKESLQKALRGLETGHAGLGADMVKEEKDLLMARTNTHKRQALCAQLKQSLRIPSPQRIFDIRKALVLGMDYAEVSEITKIDPWFIRQIKEIVDLECQVSLRKKKISMTASTMRGLKRAGFSDHQIGVMTRSKEAAVRNKRSRMGIKPTYKLVDTCGGEFPALTPYYYSTYEEDDEARITGRKKIIILGGGPNRIGQGIEFDYCCVHCSLALKKQGFETIMVNCNPETVSTDYDISDRLYFEPLTYEDVMHIVEREKPVGIIVSFGGQTPLNLSVQLERSGVKILGTSSQSIDIAEDRKKFGNFLKKLSIPQPSNGTAFSFHEAERIARRISYPVMVRPSYVLGGRAMEIVYDEKALEDYLNRATAVSPDHPILIDKFLEHAVEVDVDAVADGRTVFIGGIMEHIEEAGIHSGDSACVLPPHSLSAQCIQTIRTYTERIARGLKVCGLLNIQYAVKDHNVYILEVNPRASRTVPFVSKATGIPLAKLAAQVMIGKKLDSLVDIKKTRGRGDNNLQWVAVKEAVLPWSRFPGVDTVLGPEMRSTGEVMGIDTNFSTAFAKSQAAAGTHINNTGAILFSLCRGDKKTGANIARDFLRNGFSLMATRQTAAFFRSQGLDVTEILKISEGRPHVVDVIKNKQVCMVINTPSGQRSRSDGYAIRQAALVHTIPIFTTLAAAHAALQGILARRQGAPTVHSLQSLYIQQASGRQAEKLMV
ncbi:MAG: carbamoyl-phosphate synthase large subunit [Elusimicrobia bacterium]|nr:carbamoyl-phosphate synthase large subunit [Elusimicrobiota bacterium]MBD3411867.1 carbamoyl-phosphate synthase large subunit [Elusimicrobiota bacterium]